MNPSWTVRASLAADGTATVRTRSHSLKVGQALDFGAASQGTSSLELLLGALCADVLLRFRDLCDRKRVALDQAEIRVSGQLGNALVALSVVGEEGDPGLSSATVLLSVASPAAEALLQDVWQEVLARSPIVATLRKCAHLTLDLQIL